MICKILLSILFAFTLLIYILLCCLYISKFKKYLRIVVIFFFLINVLISYFLFPRPWFYGLSSFYFLLYILWESTILHPSKVFFSWIDVRTSDFDFKIVVPRFLTFVLILFCKFTKRFRKIPFAFGTEIKVETKEEVVDIRI